MIRDIGLDAPIVSTQPIPDQPGTEAYLFPCSLAQQTWWFLDEISSGTAVNNIAVRFRLDGPLNVNLLEDACLFLIDRHESLRTRFVSSNGEPQQLVEPRIPFSLQVSDLTRLKGQSQQEEIERLSTEEASAHFDLKRGPLLRAHLVKVTADQWNLLLTVAHIIADGWSMGILTRELGEVYGCLVEGREPDLRLPELQYADYCCWQQEWIASGEHEKELQFWRDELQGLPPLEIRTDFERPRTPTRQGEIRSILLPRSLTDALKTLSDRENCTFFMATLSAVVSLLHHESGQEDIAVRTQVARRSSIELEPVVGCFVNSVILRVNAGGNPSFRELMGRVKQAVVRAFDHQEVPFEQVVGLQNLSKGRQMPFPVNFVTQRAFMSSWRHGGVTMTPIPSTSAGTFADWNIFLVEREEGWRASLEVDKDVFTPATAQTVLATFQHTLNLAVANPALRINDIKVAETRTGNITTTHERKAYAQPRSPVEVQLVKIWERVLGIEQIGIHDDFFDLGGHSLIAAKLMAETRHLTTTPLPVSILVEAPTIEQLARRIVDQKEHSCLITIQAGKDRLPLFCIHGYMGDVINFRDLAKYLGDAYPIYALRSPDAESDSFSLTCENLATTYLAEMQRVQPDGPYCLLGYSLGGVIAFEMAQQLSRSGKEVVFLGLLDILKPCYRQDMALLERFGENLRIQWRRVQMHAKELIDSQSKATHLYRLFRGRILKAIYRVYENVNISVPVQLRVREHANWFAATRYVPSLYPGSVTLFRSEVTGSTVRDSTLGWGNVSGKGIEVFTLSGDHTALLKEPNVAVVVERLHRALDAVRT